MKKLIRQLLFTLSFVATTSYCFGQCVGTAAIDLEANNVRARLNNNGTFWYTGTDAGYEVPSGSGIHSLFAGSLWMGGVDPGGNLKLAAQDYGAPNGQNEYFPGPLDASGTTNPTNCANWDRFFMTTRAEVDAFRADWEDNMTIDDPIPSSILGWPARGNANFESIHGFELPTGFFFGAPYVDTDQNGMYNPDAGDFPFIRGDQNIFWIYNDNGGIHGNSNGDPIGMQINCMAYSSASDNELVNNTTFYDFATVYTGDAPLSDFGVGIWIDPDLGCWNDDYIGSIPQEDMGYVYNADEVDPDCNGLLGYQEDIPVLSVKILNKFSANGSDGMSSFMYYLNQNVAPTAAIADPSIGLEYYNYLRGNWRDGTPLSQGGTGYAPGSNPYSYAFDGSSVNGSDWKECELDNMLGDRRMLMNMDFGTLFPGSISAFTFAVMWKRQLTPDCPNVEGLIQDGNTIAQFDSIMIVSNTSDDPGPLALFDKTIFANSTVQFTDLSLFDPVQWMWDLGDGTTSILQNPSHVYSMPGNYTVCLTVTNANGMSSTTCEVINIRELMPPVADFDFTIEPGSGGEVSFEDMSTNNPTFWSWDFGDSNTSDLQSPTHTYTANGDYEVCLTATNDDGPNEICKTVSIILSGLNELNEQNNIRFHPNPVHDFCKMEMPNLHLANVQIQVYDCLGKKIAIAVEAFSLGMQLDMNNLTSGIYFIEVRDEEGVLLGGEKLVKL